MADFTNPRKRLESLIGKLLDSKEDVTNRISGMLGTYDQSGNEVVDVQNRPDFVYVRIGGSFSEVIEAFNQSVDPEFDTKVLLVKSALGNFYEVLTRDIPQYSTWGGNSFTPLHALQHMFGEGINEGSDPVFIYKRQLLQPLGVHPNPTGSMSGVIEADFYIWNNTIKYYPGGETTDFTPLLPTGSYSRYITIYLDGNEEIIKYVTGTTFEPTIYTTGTIDFIPEISPLAGIPLSAVYISTGTQILSWENFFDIRNFLNQGGNTTLLHGLDPLDGYHSGTLRSSVVTAVDFRDYYTGSTVEDILQEIFPLTTGGIIAKNDVVVGRRNKLNFHEGAGIGISISDDPTNDEIDLTFTSTGSSGGGTPSIHELDPSFGIHTGTLRSSVVTVLDTPNYFTGTVVESVLQETYETLLSSIKRSWFGI